MEEEEVKPEYKYQKFNGSMFPTNINAIKVKKVKKARREI